jgi:2-amino-4-hydroxy-6-hydroxymethyldihydropteridine diphosphokinase
VNGDELAVVALGANLGDRVGSLRGAAAAIARLGRVDAASGIYETAPVGGPTGQDPYLNAVLVVAPSPPWASPRRLLDALLALEVGVGRVRRERWGPRVLDLDLIAFGTLVEVGPELTIPHPHAHERAFVMVPLAEAYPGWQAPGGERAGAVARRLDARGVRRTELSLWP